MKLNHSGAGILPMVAGISVISVLGVAAMSQMGLDIFRRSSYAYSEWETNLGNQKALGLGGYFVAHNLVLCREDGWEDLGSNKKCRWGGGYHTPRIPESKYNIKSVRHEDDVLVLVVENKDDNKKVYTTELKMDLVDWSKQSSFRSLVGEIPFINSLSDDDRFMVVMTAVTQFMGTDGRAKEVSKSGAIRRPIGTPDVQVISNTGRESCIFECEAGSVLTNNPECRGPLGAPQDGASAMIGVRITNLGPGAIYKLKYERTTTYNSEIYPNREKDVMLVDAMGKQEVFMPGEKLNAEVERKCYSPVRVFQTQRVSREVEGDSASSSTSTSVTVASSFKSLSYEKFDISVSRYSPMEATKPQFRNTYNPYVASTFVKNPTLSVIEPKRLGVQLPEIEVTSPQESVTETTTVTTMVVRPRPVEVMQSSGDGDGDN